MKEVMRQERKDKRESEGRNYGKERLRKTQDKEEGKGKKKWELPRQQKKENERQQKSNGKE